MRRRCLRDSVTRAGAAALALAFALGPWAASLDAAKRRRAKPPPEASEYMGQSMEQVRLQDCKPGAVATVNDYQGYLPVAGYHRWCYYGRRDGRR